MSKTLPGLAERLARIQAAHAAIAAEFKASPQVVLPPHEKLQGTEILLKLETLNPIRSFKGRGADWFVTGLIESFNSQVNASMPEVVCASAGNFGQGLAWACRRRGLRCVVFAATSARPGKIRRMRELGATVTLVGADFDEAKFAARSYAEQVGGIYVEDGREPRIAEGAGTIALELISQCAPIDAIAVPVGNGSLINGIAACVKALSPQTRVIGVCAAGAPSMALSYQQRAPVETSTAVTAADGIAVRVPVPEAVIDLCELVDEIILVDEDRILEAEQILYQTLALVIEPAGAVGLAGIVELHTQGRFVGSRVATVICGANGGRESLARVGEADGD